MLPFRRRTHALLAAPALALLLGGGALAADAPAPTPPAAAAPAPAGALARHVVVVSIDGLRPDAIERFGARTLQRLMREGSYTLEARTILPSKTLPSHTSMLTGTEVEEHGVTWNENQLEQRGYVRVPTVFATARAQGLHTAAFFSKGKFHHLSVPGTLDHLRVPEGNGRYDAEQTAAHVEEYLAAERPNLTFVHFGEPDRMGHRYSWMSWWYARAVRRTDAALERVLGAADRAFGAGNYSVIVTADHGGHGWIHGTDDARDVTIPWIAWGRGVEQGTVLPAGVRTLDTAATALWLLGVAEQVSGEPVRVAFGAGDAPALAGSRAADAPRGGS